MKIKKPLTLMSTYFLLIFALLFTVSCEEDDLLDLDGESCASCTETISGYSPPDYCSTDEAVNLYISELRSVSDQNWVCSKY